MSLVTAKNLRKSYGQLVVLDGVSFALERGQKVALVGGNGTGKTTLLKMIAGAEETEVGSLTLAKNARVAYFQQDLSLLPNQSIAAYLQEAAGADIPPHRMEAMLAGFGLESLALERDLATLSSGQKSKVALAGILLQEADLLLLDEPTNNLDLPALIWLEDFLQKTKAACLVVSHDRRFLDRVAEKIFELDWHDRTLKISGGTYSDYLARALKQLASQKEAYRLQQEEIARLKDRASQKRDAATAGENWTGPSDKDKMLRGFKRDRSKSSARSARALERRVEQMERVDLPAEREPFAIPLEAALGAGVLDIDLVEVLAGYGSEFRVGPLTLELPFGRRVGIMGLNGAGKSTLLKTLTGDLPLRGGQLNRGAGVRVGNLMQEHESLPREESLLQFLKVKAGIDHSEGYNQLGKFGFSEAQATQAISILSPGGRARLLLALFAAQGVNVLILDEPTNHLDLEALAALEETLELYRGTVVVVSHDRYFLEKARLDELYVLAEGQLSLIADFQTYVTAAEERARKLLKII
jgi:ATPase subunit of ABC transporter with duplicated ATPase domains